MNNNTMSAVRAYIALTEAEKIDFRKAIFVSENSDFDLILADTRKGLAHLSDLFAELPTGANVGHLVAAEQALQSIEYLSCK